MGAWGTDIFENDAAADLALQWERLLEEDMLPEQASQRLRYPHPDNYVSLFDEPELVYALVALQIDTGALEDDLATEAIQMIEEDYNLEIWNEPDERRQALTALRDRIEKHRLERAKERSTNAAAKSLRADGILY